MHLNHQLSARRLSLPVLGLTLLILGLSGCATLNLAPDYDPVMDQTVSKLQADTATFFEKMATATGKDRDYEANKAFYDASLGTVEAMQTRARVLEEDIKAKLLSKNFERLKEQFDDLRLLHETSPSENTMAQAMTMAMASAKKSFDQMFNAILIHIRMLKTGETTS